MIGTMEDGITFSMRTKMCHIKMIHFTCRCCSTLQQQTMNHIYKNQTHLHYGVGAAVMAKPPAVQADMQAP